MDEPVTITRTRREWSQISFHLNFSATFHPDGWKLREEARSFSMGIENEAFPGLAAMREQTEDTNDNRRN